MKNYIVESVEHNGYVIEIVPDENALDPRKEWDNFGTMICFHKRYNLGDSHYVRSGDFSGWNDMEDYIRNQLNASVVLPIFMYDHSGITINTSGFSCPWDSGQIGFIYASREKIRSEFNCDKITKKTKDKVASILQGEVETYNHYVAGDVYGWIIRKDDEILDSVWGYMGNDFKYMIDEAKAQIDSYDKKIDNLVESANVVL